MFDFFFSLVADTLSFLYDINNSYALAIILLTFIVLVVSTPLTLSGTKSMLKMQLLQPELKDIQNRYDPKTERDAMNAEMMEFYKENQINPIGGCVPLLFQIPVFLILYRVILGITRRATDSGIELGEVVGSLRAGESPELVDTTGLLEFNPAFIDQDSQLFQDLSSTNMMDSLGFDLARSASQVLGDGIVPALPYLILVLVVGVSGFIQHKMIRSRNSGAPVNPTQEQIMKILPFFLPIFSFTLPAAIVFYFLVSNLYRIGQQAYITRSFYKDDDSLGGQIRQRREEEAKGGNKKKSNKASGNNSKNGSNKGANKKGATQSKKKGNSNKGGSGANGGKSGRHRKPASSSNGSKQSSAPGRNSSGRGASAREVVEPKSRKKTKR